MSLLRLLFVVLAAAAPAVALAATGAAHHEPQWSLTLLGFANFAIYAWLMKRFAWPLIKDYLQDRHDEVVRSLEAAALARREAERLKSDFELRMNSLEAEAARAREEILGLARVEADRLIQQAEHTAALIRKDAQLVADQEVARARRALQAESAALVTKMASDIVSSQLQPGDQDRFLDDFLGETREGVR